MPINRNTLLRYKTIDRMLRSEKAQLGMKWAREAMEMAKK